MLTESSLEVLEAREAVPLILRPAPAVAFEMAVVAAAVVALVLFSNEVCS